MTTKELTKAIQKLVGVSTDGVWGKNTAQAVLDRLEESEARTDTVDVEVNEKMDSEVVSAEASDDNSRWKDLYDTDDVTLSVMLKCQKVLNVFETGKVEGDPCGVYVYKDGGGGKYRQLTYALGATQDGTLDIILAEYLQNAIVQTPAYSVIKAHYPTKGVLAYADDKELINALKEAGKEPVMQAAQDKVFTEHYFNPAYKWFHDNGFTKPLSLLVIYDSFIHSGSILSFLRKRFSEVPPTKGGDEKAWIQAYVSVRRSWLENHSNKVLRNTVYRMKCMQDCIDKDNWDLSQPVNAHGTIIS